MKPLPDKQQIVDSIARVAKHLGHTPSILEFAAHAEISRSSLFLLFPKWNDAVRAARLKPNRLYVRPTDSELLKVIEAVQKEFPDCEAKRQIVPGRWQRVLIEFEFESKNFHGHGHPPSGCDVVCWRHNWPDCPKHIEVLELSTVIQSLASSED